MGSVSLCCFTLWHTHTHSAQKQSSSECVLVPHPREALHYRMAKPSSVVTTAVFHVESVCAASRLLWDVLNESWKRLHALLSASADLESEVVPLPRKSGDIWINRSDPAFIIITHSLLTVCEILFLCNQGSSREQTDYLHLYSLAY